MTSRGQPSRRVQTEPKNERWRLFLEGKLTIHDMDEEELARGTFRAADGTFRGRPPKTVPRTFAQQLSRELLRRGESEIRRYLLGAIRTLGEISGDGEKDSDRVRASNILLERVMGKVPERVVISEGVPEWQEGVGDLMAAAEEDEKIRRARERLSGEEVDGSRFARPKRRDL
jgi:hypothetical protein